MLVLLERLIKMLALVFQSNSKPKNESKAEENMQIKVVTCPNCSAMISEDEKSHSICGWVYVKEYITLDMYLNKHKNNPELDQTVINNAKELLKRVNSLFTEIGMDSWDIIVTSGWRPRAYNLSVGGARKSRHIKGQAIDLYDPTGQLYEILSRHLPKLTRRRLSLEDGRYTKGWVHIQWPPPGSGRTVFIPYAGPPRK